MIQKPIPYLDTYHGAKLVFFFGGGGRKSHTPPVGTIFASVSTPFSRCFWKDSFNDPYRLYRQASFIVTRPSLIHHPCPLKNCNPVPHEGGNSARFRLSKRPHVEQGSPYIWRQLHHDRVGDRNGLRSTRS